MASASRQRRCNACNIWVASADHWRSQSHLDMSKRKYSDSHDRGRSKPFHTPRPPSNPDTRPVPKPQTGPDSSSSAPSRSPRTYSTTTRTQRPIPPSTPQNFNDVGYRSRRSCNQRAASSSKFTLPPASSATSNSANTQHLFNPAIARPPAMEPTSSTPRTSTSTPMQQQTIPPSAPQGCFCAACNTYISFSAITSHLAQPTHTAKCKSLGLFCVQCQKPFLNHHGLRVHKDTTHKVDPRLAEARREIGLYCRDCDMTFHTWLLLRIHIHTECHRAGIPIPLRSNSGRSHAGIPPGCDSPRIPASAASLNRRSYVPTAQPSVENLIPTAHTPSAPSNADSLYCLDCSGTFSSPSGLWYHDCLPSSGPYACPTCPRTFATTVQRDMHSSHCIPISKAPEYSFCRACMEEITEGHRDTKGHVERCKEKGLYCWVCEIAFLGEQGFHAHRVVDSGHRVKVKMTGRVFCTMGGVRDEGGKGSRWAGKR
jgi:hypothetical protein